MKISLIKRPDGNWEPETEQDLEKSARFAFGEVGEFTSEKVRSPLNHRRYFAMLNLAFENQDRFDDFDTFRKTIQMMAGYYDTIVNPLKAEAVMYWPKSIAYNKLDEKSFSRLKLKVGDVLVQKFDFPKEVMEDVLKLSAINKTEMEYA